MPTPLLNIQPHQLEHAIELAAQGKYVRDIAKALGCSMDHLAVLRARDTHFEKRFCQARILGRELLAESVATITDDDPFGDPQILRLKSDNMKWFLGVQDPAKYGQRQTVTVESVDLGSALTEARQRANRVIDVTPAMTLIEAPDPFE